VRVQAYAERLAHVERELGVSPYAGLELLDDVALWPARWRMLLARLAAVPVAPTVRAAARPDSDLGRLQRGRQEPVTGDGTLVLFRAETAHEACEATAALAAAVRPEDLAIIRGGEAALLDAALVRHGVAALGATGSSAWRPALQVLPLTLELLLAPRDPYRALELLSLPLSPFAAVTRQELSRALAEAPGIGGRPWLAAKERIRARLASYAAADADGDADADADADGATRIARQLDRIHDWFEAPAGATVGKASALEAIARVASWLHARRAFAPADPTLGPALEQAGALAATLEADHRAELDAVDLRLLLDGVARRATVPLSVAQAGRPAVVDGPAGLRRPRGTVLWSHFVAGAERSFGRPPWRAAELAALARRGITFPGPVGVLAAQAQAWRQVIHAAADRLILVAPVCAAGAALHLHPLWAEIAARLGLDEHAQARLTRTAHSLPHEALPPLPLPEARAVWTTPPITVDRLSASSLDTLTACPLRYVLEKQAKLHRGALASVPSGPRLHGSLGHRLVEQMHRELPGDPATLRQRAASALDALIATEAATLGLPGASFESRQVREQLIDAVVNLVGHLEQGGFAIAGVEETFERSWAGITLHGRLDLRLTDRRGGNVILDLKWRTGAYFQALITKGIAIQLAVYAALLAAEASGPLAPGGYFSLLRGTITSADPVFGNRTVAHGPSLEETLTRVEHAMRAVSAVLARGEVHATGLSRSLPLADPLGAPDRACGYCQYDALCGRRWEARS
jgi:hypothetical protein